MNGHEAISMLKDGTVAAVRRNSWESGVWYTKQKGSTLSGIAGHRALKLNDVTADDWEVQYPKTA